MGQITHEHCAIWISDKIKVRCLDLSINKVPYIQIPSLYKSSLFLNFIIIGKWLGDAQGLYMIFDCFHWFRLQDILFIFCKNSMETLRQRIILEKQPWLSCKFEKFWTSKKLSRFWKSHRKFAKKFVVCEQSCHIKIWKNKKSFSVKIG